MDGIGGLVLGLIFVAVLLFLNAVFVASEFAYVTVRRRRIEQMAEEGSSVAKRILSALGNVDFYVAASQLGITMASIALGTLGEPVLAQLIEPPVVAIVGTFSPTISHAVAIAAAFIFANALHIIFGEFVPKSIALQSPEGTARRIAWPMDVFVTIFRPAIWLLNSTGFLILRLLGLRTDPVEEETLRAEDLALTLETSASAGIISRHEMILARHVLELSSVIVEDILIPRSELITLSADMSKQEVLATFAEYRHTRYPVHRGDIDEVIGVLDMKDVLFALDEDQDWTRQIEPPLLLPASVSLEHLLEESQRTNTAMAIALDEYGGVAGAATIFDAIEFLAGRFPDEFDPAHGPIVTHEGGEVTVDGLVRLPDLEEELGIELSSESSRTIGGLVMERLGRIPKTGDQVSIGEYRAEVLEMDEMRVASVRLAPESPRTGILERGQR